MAPRRRLDDPSSQTDMAVNDDNKTALHRQQQGLVGDDDASDEVEQESEETLIAKKRNNEESSTTLHLLQRLLRDVISFGLRRNHVFGRRVVGLAVTALILIGYYRSRRRQRPGNNNNNKFPRLLLSSLSSSTILLWKQLLLLLFTRPEHESAIEAPLSHLLRAADEGLIQRALLGSSVVYYYCRLDNNNTNTNTTNSAVWRRSTLPHGNPQLHSNVLEKLTSSNANTANANATATQVSALGESLASRMATPLIMALPFVYLGLLYRMMKHLHGGADNNMPSSSGSSSGGGDGNTNKKTTTFADVAGLNDVVEQVYDVVSYLRDPDRYAALGARPPRGILLYGPPGGGKTLIARAVAGEAHVDAFLSCSASEFVELYVGRGAARVRALFHQARQQARSGARKRQQEWWNSVVGLLKMIGTSKTSTNSISQTSALARKKTAIIFIDELDALAKTRASWNSNDEREQTLNQLLTEMDGFATGNNDNDNNDDNDDDVTVIVMAASNRADVIDPAVLRRFDRQIHVGYPDQTGRKSILQIHARRVLCTPAGTIDWDALALQSDGFSGADLRNAANEAALVAVRDQAQAVDHAHLSDAIQRIGQMKETVKRRPPHNSSSSSTLLSSPFFKVELN